MRYLKIVVLGLLIASQVLISTARAQSSGPQLSVSPNPVACGGTLSVSGTGWPTYSTVYLTLYAPDNTFVGGANAQTASSGTFSNISISVPATATAGTYSVRGQSGLSYQAVSISVTCGGATLTPTATATATATATLVTYSPAITGVSPNPASPGSYVTVSGSGFPANATVYTSVYCGSLTVLSGQTQTTNAAGYLTFSFTVPTSTTASTCSIYVTGNGFSAVTYTFPVQSTGNITISVSPSTVAPGNSVTVTVYGLAANSTFSGQINLTLVGGISQPKPFNGTAGSNGSGSVTVTIPANTEAGTYSVTLTNPATSASTNLTVSSSTAIQIQPTSVVAGNSSSVTVTGSGFQAYESITISFTAPTVGSQSQTFTVTTNATSTGAIPSGVTLPIQASVVPGTYTVTAKGASSNATATATLTVTPNPVITITPATVNRGGTITIAGKQFTPNTSVSITANIALVNNGSQPLTQSVTTGADGTFSITYNVPINAADTTDTVNATANASGQSEVASATFTVTHTPPTISVSTTYTTPASSITVSGQNFAPGYQYNAPVSIVESYTNPTGQASTSTTVYPDTNGAFSTSLIVPVDAVTGTVTVTATQQVTGLTASTTFQVVGATATLTPTATATRTPTPIPSLTPIPTSTSTPVTIVPTPLATATFVPTIPPTHHPPYLKIKNLSVWYHYVRLGTYDHVHVKTNKKMVLPITLRVHFPWGALLTYKGKTSKKGTWDHTFSIPRNSHSRPGIATILITVRRNHTAKGTIQVHLIR